MVSSTRPRCATRPPRSPGQPPATMTSPPRSPTGPGSRRASAPRRQVRPSSRASSRPARVRSAAPSRRRRPRGDPQPAGARRRRGRGPPRGRPRPGLRTGHRARPRSGQCTAEPDAYRLGARLCAEDVGARSGLQVEVFDRDALAELGCGGLLGVNAGSTDEPRMIQLRLPAGGCQHAPDAGRQGHHVRLRRHQPQARRRVALADEERHVRRGGDPGGDGGAERAGTDRPRSPAT